MAENLSVPATGDKKEKYEALVPQISALIGKENDFMANLANTAAALHQCFGFFWVGFYLVKGDELVLAPFQGPVACTRIKRGKGVCGKAWETAETVIVPDVDQFPGHIACNADSKSEIVVPMVDEGHVIGVLDIDSNRLNAFDQSDKRYLEQICEMIVSIRRTQRFVPTWQIIQNPNALLRRSRRFWKDIENKFKEAQLNYLPHVTSTVAEAKELIIGLCKKGERHFVLLGGDGTLNSFINAVMQSSVNPSEVYAALIPLGTGNDWCRSHGYSNRYLDAVDALIQGHFACHDVGLVETIVDDQVIDVRYFVNIAGFGFDGAVIFNANKKSYRFFNKQLYLINLLKTLIAYRSQEITLKSLDFTITKAIFSMAVGICQYNGNGMRQCPDAIPDDGLFDVVVIDKVSVWKVLQNIKNLYKGAHVNKLKEVSVFRTANLDILSTPFIWGEVEGETLKTGHYRIRCLGSAIHLMVFKFPE